MDEHGYTYRFELKGGINRPITFRVIYYAPQQQIVGGGGNYETLKAAKQRALQQIINHHAYQPGCLVHYIEDTALQLIENAPDLTLCSP